ncbi:phosphoribosyltransferase [Rhizobium sp. LjRoot254]|uniref:phosphoribosyltransferase n=1 Tax=Rhizobium sp. LjRoot254 TaxID=3342297 RepID=UPI003ECD00E5
MFGSAEFRDRTDAGRQLAEALGGTAIEDPVVLALPRGGAPVAYEIARFLDAPLDLLFVRKIGAPANKEYGVGAVIDGDPPERVLDRNAMRYAGATDEYVEEETTRELAVIAERRARYLGGRAPIPLAGRNVILVDDGIATGNTVLAAIKGLRQMQAAYVLLAVPVAPPETIERLAREVDRVNCLSTPRTFMSVGGHYDDFGQVPDEEVMRIIGETDHPERGTPSSRSISS